MDNNLSKPLKNEFIAWRGGMFAPVRGSEVVDVKHRDEHITVNILSGSVIWYHSDKPNDVIAYRLRKNIYSQEYVSALLAELKAKGQQLEAESAGADKCADNCIEWMKRAKAAEKRIAELEAERVKPVVIIPSIWKHFSGSKVALIYEQAMDAAGVKWRSVDDKPSAPCNECCCSNFARANGEKVQ